MKTYAILIDGYNYGGEDPYSEEDARPGLGMLHPIGRNRLLIGFGLKQIQGNRGLKSELERITSRMTDGSLTAQEIVIKVVS